MLYVVSEYITEYNDIINDWMKNDLIKALIK